MREIVLTKTNLRCLQGIKSDAADLHRAGNILIEQSINTPAAESANLGPAHAQRKMSKMEDRPGVMLC